MRYFPRSLALLTAAVFLLPCAAARSQAQTGTLTGAVMSPDSKVVQNTTTLLSGGVFIDVIRHDPRIYDPGDSTISRGALGDTESQHRKSTDIQHGGLYTFDGLKPGVYDVLVEAGHVPETNTDYRPQRILGVVVKPGETDLDITVHPGATNDLEVTGTPLCNLPAQLKRGWVEGTLLGADGKTVLSTTALLAAGVHMTIHKISPVQAGKLVEAGTEVDRLSGGFFSFVGLQPGVYEIVVDKGIGFGSSPHYRPLIVRNITVKPGVLVTLNIRMHDGDALERVTAPVNMNGVVEDTTFKSEPFKVANP
jgi:hypothetical protein